MKFKILITLLIILLTVLLVGLSPSDTPAIKDAEGEIIPGSISVIEKVKIGGIDQYLLIRGRDSNNPVILFVHGGPGYAQISYARKYQSEIEKNFVVVNWDQRGAGKSYSNDISSDSMNLEQFLADTNQVIDYLRERFHREKIYVAGHSWGSTLGLMTAKRYPEKLYAYIGIGQVVDYLEGDKISYEYTISQAKKDENIRAIKELMKIGNPPYDNIDDLMVERKWLAYYGGVEKQTNTLKDIITGILFSPEYNWIDGIRFYEGNKFSMKTISSSFNYIKSGSLDINLMEQAPELEIPVYFCMGRYDYNTPYELVEEYYKILKAPEKKLFWFDKSAHFPHFEEPDKFNDVLLEILKNTQS